MPGDDPCSQSSLNSKAGLHSSCPHCACSLYSLSHSVDKTCLQIYRVKKQKLIFLRNGEVLPYPSLLFISGEGVDENDEVNEVQQSPGRKRVQTEGL